MPFRQHTGQPTSKDPMSVAKVLWEWMGDRALQRRCSVSTPYPAIGCTVACRYLEVMSNKEQVSLLEHRRTIIIAVISLTLLMSFPLLYVHIMRCKLAGKTYFGKILRIICGVSQIAIISIAIACAVPALKSRSQAYWIEPIFSSALHASVATNVRHLSQKISPELTRPLGCSKSSVFRSHRLDSFCCVQSNLDRCDTRAYFQHQVSLCSQQQKKTSQHEYDLFLYLAGIATLALTVSAEPIYARHWIGRNGLRFTGLLIAFVTSNAAVMVCHLMSAVVIYVHSVSNRVTSIDFFKSCYSYVDRYFQVSTH